MLQICINKCVQTKPHNSRDRGNNDEIYHPAIKLQERKLCQNVRIEKKKKKLRRPAKLSKPQGTWKFRVNVF